MSSQIFKEKFSPDILFKLLNTMCKTKNPYILNKECFKMIQLNEEMFSEFLKSIEPFYYNSKKHYVTKKITINNLFTIIRQICNFLKIEYTSQIKYFKSKYEIIYYIFREEPL